MQSRLLFSEQSKSLVNGKCQLKIEDNPEERYGASLFKRKQESERLNLLGHWRI